MRLGVLIESGRLPNGSNGAAAAGNPGRLEA